MISLCLATEKQLVKPAHYFSGYFEQNNTAYVDHMIAVRQENNMQDWLVFFLHGVEGTTRGLARVARAVLALKERTERAVLPRPC